jgi:hypothetical protein
LPRPRSLSKKLIAAASFAGEFDTFRALVGHDPPATAPPLQQKTPPERGFSAKRMMGLEPTTFCMASRRSSQLSYIRA